MNSNDQIKKPLDRKSINALRDQSEKARKELRDSYDHDSFESDALDGWEKVNFDTRVLKKLDKHFLSSNNILKWIVTSSIIGMVIIAVVITVGTDNDSESKNLVADSTSIQLNTVEKTDIIPDPQIEKLVELTSNQTARSENLQKKFNEELSHQTQQSKQSDPEMVVEPLPIIDRSEIKVEHPKTIKKSTAKEIYLSRLKLIDYRSYRSRPTIPAEQLELSGTPADRESSGSETIEGSWKTVEVPYHDYIKKTMELVEKEKYQKALQRLNIVLETYPDDINGHFYSGICFFNLKQFDKAIEHFRSCLAHPFSNFDEESIWLLANAMEEMDDHDKAKELYQEIKEAKGYYADQAQNKLKRF